jgi:hypothetical protein
VLVDPADAGKAAQLKGAAVVVPVLYRLTKTENQAAERVYASVLKADKANDAIVLVNNLVRSRSKTRPTP